MSLLEDVSLALQAGRAPKVKELVQQAVDEGIPAKDVLEQGLLSGISAAGASIVTITQSRPENGAAQVEVTVRTGTMQMTVDEMLTRLSHQPCVVEIHRGA